MVHLLVSLAHATSVRALVRVDEGGAQLVDAVLVEQDPRIPRMGPGDVGHIEVLGIDGALDRVTIPDPRHRSVVGVHDRVVLDSAYTLMWLPWPDDARELRVAGERRVPRAAPPATSVLESGDASERLDLVILGDGYTADEQDLYAQDVSRIVGYMLSIEPYGAYADVFNVWRVDAVSEESGVSHYEGSSPVERDTAYGCFYGCGGISRLVCCDDTRVLGAVMDEAPGADGVLVLVNDPSYGGSGGFEYAVSYTAESTGEQVAVHELGHSLVGLWDEYSYGVEWGAGPTGPNCTRDEDAPPWTAWLDDDIDAYAPCSYSDLFRPTFGECMMNTLRDDYCPVCREQVVLALHGALPGLVVGSWGGEGSYGVEPVHSGLDVEWSLDGERVGEGTELTLEPCSEGTLTATVFDPTGWVRVDEDGLLTDEVQWSVECPPTTTRQPEPRCGCHASPRIPLGWLALGLAALVRRRLH